MTADLLRRFGVTSLNAWLQKMLCEKCARRCGETMKNWKSEFTNARANVKLRLVNFINLRGRVAERFPGHDVIGEEMVERLPGVPEERMSFG